ncbi:MAG: hypothetical protein RIT81_46200 [Deltaproteobacteria bacterium]
MALPPPLARATVASLLLTSCATHQGALAVGDASTTLVGFDAEQRVLFERTLRDIEGLEASTLAIDADDYRTASTFARTFGFDFDGPALLAWWSRRVHRVRVDDAWTVAVYDGEHTIAVTEAFFALDPLERIYALVHEARHADGDGYRHADCPASAGRRLAGTAACDDRPDGAYTFQAALLFELYAYGLVDPAGARVAWLSTKRRIINAAPPSN